jgi:hypothetical protein
MHNRPDIPDIAGIIGFRSAAPPAMHNEVAIARLFYLSARNPS